MSIKQRRALFEVGQAVTIIFALPHLTSIFPGSDAKLAAEDHTQVRRGLKSALGRDGGDAVVGIGKQLTNPLKSTTDNLFFRRTAKEALETSFKRSPRHGKLLRQFFDVQSATSIFADDRHSLGKGRIFDGEHFAR